MRLLSGQMGWVRFVLAVLLVPCGLVAQDKGDANKAPEIVSPFVRPKTVKQAPPPAAANPLDNFEFTGLMIMGGVLQVSVFDKKDNRSYWLTESVANDEGILLKSHVKDSNGNIEQVTLEKDGMTKDMMLATASIVAIPAGELAADASANSPTMGPNLTPAKPNSNKAVDESATDDEVRGRMKRVAEEIRRRRAMRSKILKEKEQNKK